ncbi:6-phospho-3-hexuloisomerase [Paenibacillus phyllosphaerae]|uniref:6-phospho-3-hexuloisomerase n=1 Tax=Paenibacillus phyllosphaerae TaxID=274593 RepID=A0A7W5AVU3_9BACL|nr:6-phospho-3-hexuloisomerase [Paenibacillus phyllosphaerae]MBB3109517.1 6-phospho-3-hexuloisomerase [Paenibacillus phyllosphaerae]
MPETAVTTTDILAELTHTLRAVNAEEMEALAAEIAAAQTIFVCGAGRTGLMMRAFAMRLMHMGLRVFVVGESVTPGLASGDLLIVGSGSGQTKSLVAMAAKAQSLGASIAAITIDRQSAIGQMASCVVAIPAQAKDSNTASIQPMGSLFEQALLLMLDAIILQLMDRNSLTADEMYGRHANLE